MKIFFSSRKILENLLLGKDGLITECQQLKQKTTLNPSF